jgi:muramoyltetrapeptide carboxypeptidase LdcA involved in peptidoglycan recycling
MKPEAIELYNRAASRLRSIGYQVTYGNHTKNILQLGTAAAGQRARDFNDAFADSRVKAVMAAEGGWSSNEILPFIDWGAVKLYPKPFVGYSDITALHNAIYAKTGAVSYLGPNFKTLGYDTGWQYTLDHLKKIIQNRSSLLVFDSLFWGQPDETTTRDNSYRYIIQPGQAQGVIIGGSLSTFYLLQGTEYQPKFNKPFILAVEDDDETGVFIANEFSRRLDSILQQHGCRKYLRGILVGRFQPGDNSPERDIEKIIISKGITGMPIVGGLDFGHTLPMFTLPIGGEAFLSATSDYASLKLL